MFRAPVGKAVGRYGSAWKPFENWAARGGVKAQVTVQWRLISSKALNESEAVGMVVMVVESEGRNDLHKEILVSGVSRPVRVWVLDFSSALGTMRSNTSIR